jgi:hypothetical protein
VEENQMSRVEVDVLEIRESYDRRIGTAGCGGIADEVEMIRQRAHVLSGTDRALVMLYLDKGRRFAEVSQLMGVCEGTVARRVGRIVRRLMDGQYITCLRHRGGLGRLGLAVAKDYLIDGLSVHAIAVRRNITVYRVRKALNEIRRLLRENAAPVRRDRCDPDRRGE